MSNRLTFSLASLTLIFALAFIASPAMAQAPSVESIVLGKSYTGNDNTGNPGDTITVTATFSASVDVAGDGDATDESFPVIMINVGGTQKAAETVAATGTTTAVFTYTIAAGDEDTDGVSVDAGSIDLNGGTIFAAGSTDDADAASRSHGALTGGIPVRSGWCLSECDRCCYHKRRCL